LNDQITKGSEYSRLNYIVKLATQLTSWNPYDQNASSPFFDAEWMFGMKEGFDIVSGNPPYGATLTEKEKTFFKNYYQTTKTLTGVQKGSMDTYTIFIENGFNNLKIGGNLIFIVPISITSSDSLTGVHKLLEDNCKTIRVSSYSVRPQPVFQNAVVNTSILFFEKTNTKCMSIYSTKMHRKSKNFNLQNLVDNLKFIEVKDLKLQGRYPKISYEIERSILNKIFLNKSKIGDLIVSSGTPIYYRTTGGRYFKVITNYSTGSTKEKPFYLEKRMANSIGAILSSNLYFWFYQIFSNNLDLKSYEIETFGIPIENFNSEIINELEVVYNVFLIDIEKNSNVRQTTKYANIDSFKEYKIGKSKHIIDKIDDIIAPLYGLTDDELYFIKNYEIQFRISDEN